MAVHRHLQLASHHRYLAQGVIAHRKHRLHIPLCHLPSPICACDAIALILMTRRCGSRGTASDRHQRTVSGR
jgi:hypothetical protein